MIVTKAKIIRVETDEFVFQCSGEKPGAVVVTSRKPTLHSEGIEITLPTNPQGAQRFVEAYMRVVNEDVGYLESGVE